MARIEPRAGRLARLVFVTADDVERAFAVRNRSKQSEGCLRTGTIAVEFDQNRAENMQANCGIALCYGIARSCISNAARPDCDHDIVRRISAL